MRLLLKPLQWLYCLYAILLFLVLMVPVFIWALLVSGYGLIKGGNLIYEACKIWADIWFPLIGIRHKNIYKHPVQKDTAYIFVANHISYLDAGLIPKAFRHPVRPLGKVEMAKIPLFGFIYKNTIVTVDRSSTSHRAKSIRRLKAILRKGISVLVFPEGTFNTTPHPLKHFYDGAFRVAIETRTPIKPVLFLNTYDRLHYDSLFSLTPGISQCIFLEPIEVTGYTLKDVKHLKQQVHALMEEKLREYKASWIKDA